MAARSVYNLARLAAQRRARRKVPTTSSDNWLDQEDNFLAQQAIARTARKRLERAGLNRRKSPDTLAGASKHERALAGRKGLRSLTISELDKSMKYFDSLALKKTGHKAKVARSMAHQYRSAINYKRRKAGTQKGMK